jgi:hypothetical protein
MRWLGVSTFEKLERTLAMLNKVELTALGLKAAVGNSANLNDQALWVLVSQCIEAWCKGQAQQFLMHLPGEQTLGMPFVDRHRPSMN